MGLGKADLAALDGGLNRWWATDMGWPGKRQFGKRYAVLHSSRFKTV
jgi:hypothetical protein